MLALDRILRGGLILGLVLLAACSGPTDSGEVPAIRRIAILRSVASSTTPENSVYREELARFGFVVGQNLMISGDGPDQTYPDPQAARAVVRSWEAQGVEVIVAYSTSGARIAAENAPSANVLFLSNDPTAAGLVKDENRPEGKLTGVTFRVPEDRTLMLARRIIPGLTRIGLAYPPGDPAAVPSRDQFASEAGEQGLELITEEFQDGPDIGRAVGVLGEKRVQLLLLSVSPTATRALPAFVEAAKGIGVPFVANVKLSDQALLSLSPDSGALERQLARQTVRLLQGASPGSIPVEDPRRFSLILNESVARRYGFTLPEDVVREADAVNR